MATDEERDIHDDDITDILYDTASDGEGRLYPKTFRRHLTQQQFDIVPAADVEIIRLAREYAKTIQEFKTANGGVEITETFTSMRKAQHRLFLHLRTLEL